MKNPFALALLMAFIAAIFMVSTGTSLASPHMRITKCENAGNYHACAIITLAGEIVEADGHEFVERTKDIATARINLSGVGGNVMSAIIIGEQVHAKHFNTYVASNTSCFSSCAIIWIAAKIREMGPNSLLLWHVAFRANDPQNADGMANVLLGIYFAHIGYDYKDAIRTFGHDPNDMVGSYVDGQGKWSWKKARWNGTSFVAE